MRATISLRRSEPAQFGKEHVKAPLIISNGLEPMNFHCISSLGFKIGRSSLNKIKQNKISKKLIPFDENENKILKKNY